MTTNALQTAPTNRNPFAAYGETIATRRLDGKPLKFNKGDYIIGKDDGELAIGTKLVAVMLTLEIGWTKWQGNKPVDRRMGLVIDGFQPPRRRDLDDYASENWETDASGALRDPWQFSNTLVFAEPRTKMLYTFNAPSRGAIGAIGELCKAHGKVMAETYPLVSLEVGSYQHSDRAIGKVKFPIFRVVEHVAAKPFDDALAASRGEMVAVESPPTAALSPPPLDAPPAEAYADALSRTIDDDIPF